MVVSHGPTRGGWLDVVGGKPKCPRSRQLTQRSDVYSGNLLILWQFCQCCIGVFKGGKVTCSCHVGRGIENTFWIFTVPGAWYIREHLIRDRRSALGIVLLLGIVGMSRYLYTPGSSRRVAEKLLIEIVGRELFISSKVPVTLIVPR